MMKPIMVFKFGGASIKDADAIRNIGKILNENYRNEVLLIVISALGKTTNGLEKVLNAAFYKKSDPFIELANVRQIHQEIIDELFDEGHPVFDEVISLFQSIEAILGEEVDCLYDNYYDQLVSFGELLSTKILSAYITSLQIENSWLDARKVIATDDTFREGKIDWATTQAQIQSVVLPMLATATFVITQGFIGSAKNGRTTTLGREGSDFTASIFSYCLDAKSMSIWKDVPGILTADPRLFKNVTKIDRLSYKEAIELTYYGAKVIHPKTIKPLQNKNIPLLVKSFLNPEGEGTYISSDVDVSYPPVVVVEKDQVLLHISTRDFSFVAEEHLSYLFKKFAFHRIKINMMMKTAISFSVCVTNVPERLKLLREQLDDNFKVIYDKNLELITVRHFQEDMLPAVLKRKVVLYEVRTKRTLQLIVRNIQIMEPV